MSAVEEPETGKLAPAKLALPCVRSETVKFAIFEPSVSGQPGILFLERAGIHQVRLRLARLPGCFLGLLRTSVDTDGFRADFLGHSIEVNESNYRTDMDIEFVRARMGRSMALDTSKPVAAVGNSFGGLTRTSRRKLVSS